MSILEKRKKARAAARKKMEKDLDQASDRILKLGKQIEETKEGSDEEKALMKRRNLYINYFNRRKNER
jgi:prefoldin subunit 5